MDNTSAWMKKLSDRDPHIKQDVRKKGLLCVSSASIISASEVLSQCRMPLTVYNSLPGSHILIGTNDDD